MSWLHGLRHRLYVLRRGEGYAREVEQELRFHAELDARSESGRQGSTRERNQRARQGLGNQTYYREEVRRVTTQIWIDRIAQDAAYAIRGLRRSPGFTAAVVLTLGLGIGVNAAMFSLLDRVFLQAPDGVVRPRELRRLYLEFADAARPGDRLAAGQMQYPQFRALRAAVDSTIALGAYTTPDSTVARIGESRLVARRARVNSDYFVVAGVHAAAGRLFTRDEDEIATPAPVAVLSVAFWRVAFGGDRQILGRRIVIGPTAFTIVGVAEPGFRGLDLDAVDVWVPANTYEGSGGLPGPWYNTSGAAFNVFVRPGSVTSENRMLTIGTNAIRSVQIPGYFYDPTILLESGPVVQAMGPGKRAAEVTVATRIAGVAFIVLLIACANVTNMLLLRASRRRQEMAVRRALGVSRWRLIEQLTVESLILAAGSGAVALLLAQWAGSAIRALMLPRVHWASGPLDLRTVGFVLAMTLLLGLVGGIAPALHAMKSELVGSLKVGSRGSGHHASRARSVLLATQAALCLVLLVGAGLFIRSLDNVASIGVGYETDDRIFLRPAFDDPFAHDDELRAAYPEAAKRLRSIDGVLSVGYTSVPPLQGASFRRIYIPGRDTIPQLPGDYGPSLAAVSPGYLAASGLPLIAGRDFNDADRASSAHVVIVGESMARLYWPGEPALGRCFMLLKRDAPCSVVIGIAADAHRRAIIEAPIAQFYLPIAQSSEPVRSLVVHTRPGRGPSVVRAAEDVFRPLVTNMVRLNARTFGSVLEPELRPWRFGATLFTALGALALAVAAIGVYAVIAYGVSQRTQEMGVRIALGAQVGDILGLVLAEALRVVATGIGLGIAAALLLGRLVASLLFGVAPSDPGVLIGAALLLAAVGMAACAIPGWRAARVQPATALRMD